MGVDPERKEAFDAEARRVYREEREADRAANGNSSEVWFELPFGLGRLGGKGRRVLSYLLTGAVIAVVVGGLYWHDSHMQEQNAKTMGYFRAIIYVLTLDEADRKGMKLDMPEELRHWKKRINDD